MKKQLRFVPLVLVLLLSSTVDLHAEIGRTQTKRERQKQERAEGRQLYTGEYDRIKQSFLTDNYAQTHQLASAYLSKNPRGDKRIEVLSFDAISLLKLNHHSEARARFKALEDAYVSGEAKAAASASIGDSYYYENNFSEAYTRYQETLSKYPQSSQAQYVTGRMAELSGMKSPLGQQGVEQHSFFSVQVGAFSKPDNAERLAERLRIGHADVYVIQNPNGRSYRVRVGKLSSRQEALALEYVLKKQGYSTKITP